MDGRKRTIQIKFRVTEAERDLILEKMKLVPTRNMEAYLRKIAIDGYIIQVDHSDIKAMTAEIQKIGVNINQIAKSAVVSEGLGLADNDVRDKIIAVAAPETRPQSRLYQCFFSPYCVTKGMKKAAFLFFLCWK